MPTKEELLAAGGRARKAPGATTAAVRGFNQGATRGFADEAVGYLESVAPRLSLPVGDFFDPSVPTPAPRSYSEARDAQRGLEADTQRASPGTYGASQLAGGVAGALALRNPSSLAGATAQGAAEGAAQGLGDSRADLTRGDVAGAAVDAAKGAAWGAGGGAAGYGVARGLQAVGQRAGQALRNARTDALLQEDVAAREAAEAAQEAAEAPIHRAQGQALEMNKAVDARTAREARIAAEREAKALNPREVLQRARASRGSAPAQFTEEPGTRTLQGYKGSAEERRAVNYDRVQAYRERLKDPNLSSGERARLEQYNANYGQAVDDPAAFARARVEQELRKRYPSEMVDNIAANRLAPDGSPISRGQAERTMPGTYEDVAKQGRAAEVVPMGGGGSAWNNYPDDAKTIQAMMPGAEVLPSADVTRGTGVQRVHPLTGIPRQLPGARTMDYGGNYAPGYIPEAKPLGPEFNLAGEAEEAMAARRAAAAASGPAAPAVEATRDSRVLRPQAPEPTPSVQPVVPAPRDISQDMTRVAGPSDVSPLAAERVAARESAAFRNGALRVAESLPGVGPVVKEGRQVLQDPAVRAKALSFARLHMLERLNPGLHARVGAQLAEAAARGDGQYRAVHYTLARKDPELRKAEADATEAASRLSDEELYRLMGGR